MPPFQEKKKTREVIKPDAAPKRTETVQRSCVTVDGTIGAAQTLTGGDNAAPPIGGSVQPRSCRSESWSDSFLAGVRWGGGGGLGGKKKRQTEKANASVCWEPRGRLRETSTCLLRAPWQGSSLWRWRTRQPCLWNSEPGGGGKKRQLYFYLIHFLIYNFRVLVNLHI